MKKKWYVLYHGSPIPGRKYPGMVETVGFRSWEISIARGEQMDSWGWFDENKMLFSSCEGWEHEDQHWSWRKRLVLHLLDSADELCRKLNEGEQKRCRSIRSTKSTTTTQKS